MSARSVFLRLVVGVVGVGFAILLAEIGLRVSGRNFGQHTDTGFTLMQFDARFGWLMKPNVEQRVNYVDVQGLPVRGNSLGFRDAEFSPTARPNACRIAFIGDSFTWGLGVAAEDRFSTLVSRGQPSWETMNFGMPGFGTDQSLLVYEQIVAPLRPNVVVFTMYQNDFVDNTYDVRYGRPKPYFELSGDSVVLRNSPVPDESFWRTGIWNRVAPPYTNLFEVDLQRRSRLVHWVARNSVLARAVYTGGRLAPQEGGGEAAPPTQPAKPLPLAPLDSTLVGRLHLATGILTRLDRDVSRQNAKLVVFLAGNERDIFHHQLAELTRLGIAVEDVTDHVLAPELDGQQHVFFPFNGHWTPRANAAVATRMQRWISQRGCQPRNRAD